MSVTAPPEGATLELAKALAGVSFAALPDGLRARTLEAVHDALACAVGGARTDLARTHRAALGMQGDGATVIGVGRAAPGTAAWLNAVAINAMDYDDTARVSGHPGATVISAALAAAESTGADGATFLSGVVAGYEAAFRVALACRPSPERYAEVHGSQCFLPFGAAGAAGRILGLDAEAMARALGLAGAMAPVPAAGKFGFDEPQLSWLKDNVHQPAETGLRAALLARAGMPASRTLLSGDKGWWRMIASDRFAESDLLGAALRGVAELAFKPWPCCRWLHAAMDAACLARAAAGRTDLPVAIRLETIAMVVALFGEKRPTTMVDAQFSAPHALATLLRDVPATAWWEAHTRDSTEAQALMDGVTLAVDPALDAAFLAGGRNVNRLPARVTLRYADGAEHAAFVDYPMGAPGRPGYGRDDDPLDERGHMIRKREALLALALDGPGCARFAGALAALPDAPDVSSLLRDLGGAGAAASPAPTAAPPPR